MSRLSKSGIGLSEVIVDLELFESPGPANQPAFTLDQSITTSLAMPRPCPIDLNDIRSPDSMFLIVLGHLFPDIPKITAHDQTDEIILQYSCPEPLQERIGLSGQQLSLPTYHGSDHVFIPTEQDHQACPSKCADTVASMTRSLPSMHRCCHLPSQQLCVSTQPICNGADGSHELCCTGLKHHVKMPCQYRSPLARFLSGTEAL